jgi:predicted DNA-binding ribbon-helix-helix protein
MNIRTTTISGGFNRKLSEGMLLKNIDEVQEQDWTERLASTIRIFVSIRNVRVQISTPFWLFRSFICCLQTFS